MYSKIFSSSLYGIDAYIVQIESHLDNQIPSVNIVGLPDAAVKEAKERVSAAIKNSGFTFPKKRITINLAPADVRKVGSGFDLPIALGILISNNVLRQEHVKDTIFIG